MEGRTPMSEGKDANSRGNHQGQFSQGVGGFAEYTVSMTEIGDKKRHDVKVPPKKVIPVVFLPGVMGSNLRMSQKRQNELRHADNRAWRPDDLMSETLKVAANVGFGGVYRKASPAQRQMIFDPNETEVEYYHYTEDKGKFDPQGTETLAADTRHKNIPDEYPPVPPLIVDKFEKQGSKSVKTTSAAQIARWRGWSEVLVDGAYESMLRTAEKALNNMLLPKEHLPEGGLWASGYYDAMRDYKITKEELRKISNCWYPVHAMGYNYLKSNADSGKAIADRIRGVVKGYRERGFQCDEVIIVTHSMGGLVARAAIHPDYGNLMNDGNVKVLGIYHSAMPTLGAAASYRRMRFGFKEQSGVSATVFAEIIGIDGQQATAILANTPAPLELLPSRGYGKDWLKVVDPSGKVLRSWPHGDETALEAIYLQPNENWWRLVNPAWVNPARFKPAAGGGIDNVYRRLTQATEFLDSIEKTFHPTQTYASFCVDKDRKSYGELVFKIVNAIWDPHATLPSPDTWKLRIDNRRGRMYVMAGTQELVLELQPATAPGDETVPADRSAKKIAGKLFPHGNKSGEDYEHQGSYKNRHVLASMLYSIAKIAQTAKWE